MEKEHTKKYNKTALKVNVFLNSGEIVYLSVTMSRTAPNVDAEPGRKEKMNQILHLTDAALYDMHSFQHPTKNGNFRIKFLYVLYLILNYFHNFEDK